MLGATPQMSPSSTKGKAVSHDCLNPANESRLHKAVYLAPPPPSFHCWVPRLDGRQCFQNHNMHTCSRQLLTPPADATCRRRRLPEASAQQASRSLPSAGVLLWARCLSP